MKYNAGIDEIIFVSAGMEKPKKRDNPIARRQKYLNYGALSLATILKHDGFKVRFIHGEHSDPGLFFIRLDEDKVFYSNTPLLLSVPSFYALSWARKFTSFIKQKYPQKKIIMGGRWVIGGESEWIRKMLPCVDKIVPGLAEELITSLVRKSVNNIPFKDASRDMSMIGLDHRLVEGYTEFQPSVEVSRGCGMGCSFCEERDIPLSKLKPARYLVNDLKAIMRQYGGDKVNPYFQSSFFAPNVSWAKSLLDEITKRNVKLAWRCETRVDAIKPETIELLARAGLRAIDLGLESASPEQLLRMNKTKNPDKYLNSASSIIESCHKNGVWVKINYLLYAGESHKTYAETINWLDHHRELFKGISVGPVVVFGPPKSSSFFMDSIIKNGGFIVDEASIQKSGIGHIHPSREISNEDAEELSLITSKRYMNKCDYYDLKSFSYYPRSYQKEDFLSDISNCEIENLPFRE